MPTKYHRDEETRETPFIRQRGGPRPLLRKRALLLYISIFFFAVIIMLSEFSRRASEYSGQPVLRGEGVVTAKRIDEGSRDGAARLLQIKVQLDPDHWASDWFPMDPLHWEAFRVGDRVGVLYQTNRSGKRIRLREAGLVALPSADR